ncbi:MAG: MFS transporter [Pseudomonadota bacterium]
MSQKKFYGWKLSWFSCLSNFCLQGSGVYLMNALIQPLNEAYGWSRGELSLTMGLGSFCGIASMSLLMMLAKYTGLRAMMLAGAAIGSLCIILLGQLTELWAFSVAFTLLWICGQACGGAISNVLMTNWFSKKRGEAFGIANFGTSFSGAILPFVMLALLHCFGIPTATFFVGAVCMCVLVYLGWKLVRDDPKVLGMHPDGEEPATTESELAPAKTEERLSWAALFKTTPATRIGFAFAFGLMTAAGVVSQLKPRFSDLGFSDYSSMALMCLTALCAALGKYLWGWVSDHIPVMFAARMLFICNILGLFIAFLPVNIYSSLAFAVGCGVFLGGFWTMYPAVVAHVFGKEHFSEAYSYTSVFVVLKSVGYVAMGMSFEYFMTYDMAFLFFGAMLFIGFVLLTNIRPYKA